MQLYQRSAVLTVGTLIFNGRVSFSIEKQGGGSPPTEIKAHNMTQNHRNHFENLNADLLTIYLSAGYGGNNKLIYAGRVRYTESLRQGPDIVTSFQTSTTVAARHQAALTLSGQLSSYDIYTRVLAALAPFGITKGYLTPAAQSALQAANHTRGYAGIGYASKLLDDITSRSGLTWTIDGDHNLNIHSFKETEDPQEIVISATSGMIGFPSKTQTAGCYKVRSLLNAELSPGKKIRIISQQLKVPGDVKIIKTTHVGDTLEGDWYTEVEAMVLGVRTNISGAAEKIAPTPTASLGKSVNA